MVLPFIPRKLDKSKQAGCMAVSESLAGIIPTSLQQQALFSSPTTNRMSLGSITGLDLVQTFSTRGTFSSLNRIKYNIDCFYVRVLI